MMVTNQRINYKITKCGSIVRMTWKKWLRDTMLQQQHTYGLILNGVYCVIDLMYWSLVYVYITD